MIWRPQARCAAVVLLLGLAGCTYDQFRASFQETDSGAARPTVDASVESVAERTRIHLNTIGVNTVVERDGNDIRLRCTSAKGKHFVLVLTEETGSNGKQTRARLEWEDGSDDPLAVLIQAHLETLGVH